MIKLLIKHKLAETAINTFFDNVIKNLDTYTSEFKIGQHIPELKAKHEFNEWFKSGTRTYLEDVTYYNSTVVDIDYPYYIIVASESMIGQRKYSDGEIQIINKCDGEYCVYNTYIY